VVGREFVVTDDLSAVTADLSLRWSWPGQGDRSVGLFRGEATIGGGAGVRNAGFGPPYRQLEVGTAG